MNINPKNNHILLRTVTPKMIPRKVAMAMPKMPARMDGTRSVLQPLAVAIPPAVVGPPTFAFDARRISRISNFINFPIPIIIVR